MWPNSVDWLERARATCGGLCVSKHLAYEKYRDVTMISPLCIHRYQVRDRVGSVSLMHTINFCHVAPGPSVLMGRRTCPRVKRQIPIRATEWRLAYRPDRFVGNIVIAIGNGSSISVSHHSTLLETLSYTLPQVQFSTQSPRCSLRSFVPLSEFPPKLSGFELAQPLSPNSLRSDSPRPVSSAVILDTIVGERNDRYGM